MSLYESARKMPCTMSDTGESVGECYDSGACSCEVGERLRAIDPDLSDRDYERFRDHATSAEREKGERS